MKVLDSIEIEQVSGGDGVAVVGGILTGVAATALVVGTGGGALLVGAALGGVIWEGMYRVLLISKR